MVGNRDEWPIRLKDRFSSTWVGAKWLDSRSLTNFKSRRSKKPATLVSTRIGVDIWSGGIPASNRKEAHSLPHPISEGGITSTTTPQVAYCTAITIPHFHRNELTLAKLTRIEWIERFDASSLEIRHVARHDSEAVFKRRCGNHQISAVVAKRGAQPPPASGDLQIKRENPENSREYYYERQCPLAAYK